MQENPTAAATLSVAEKYIAASVEINAHALAKLKYTPGVSRCRDSVLLASREMKAIGLLNPSTDPDELARRAWLDLDDVSHDWIKDLKVERIAGGGPPSRSLSDTALAQLEGLSLESCCSRQP